MSNGSHTIKIINKTTQVGCIDAFRVTTGTAAANPTFYPNSGFGGTGVALANGNYTLAQLVAAGIANDSISSLKVPSGKTVLGYADDNFSGTAWTFTADNSNLAGTGNDNLISSLKVQ